MGQTPDHFALLGLNVTVQPVTVNIVALFNIEDHQVLCLQYLKDLYMTNKVNRKPPSTDCNDIAKAEVALYRTVLLAL
eukprot:1950982-Ditylum_brightwellii.AAC.1